ncbi:MAG: hypothetical protein ACSHX9_13085 [Luteolibacter sp.]
MKLTRRRELLFAFMAVFLVCLGGANAQQGIAIPGSPKGDLPTELLQSRAYCRSMERSLQLVEDQFPTLRIEVLAANASWKSSPFAIGCDAIEAGIIEDAGEEGRAMLKKLDDDTWAEASKHVNFRTVDDAQEFLTLVDRRAKGEIEVDMVRGNLLWQYKPFRENPEKEVARGYIQKVTHTAQTSRKITFEVPMSWKTKESPKDDLMSFRNCYGHGNVWMTVFVSPTVDQFGEIMLAQERFDAYSEEELRTAYRQLGIKLTSFSKTKVNGMSALLFTREQSFEQLGQKATRAAQVIRAFTGNQMISFQINTLGPEGSSEGTERIKKYEALFKMIGGTLRVMEP